jgi:DNA repair protein RAD7
VDAQVLAAASKATTLRRLSLAFCRSIDDDALAALAAAGGSSGSNGGNGGISSSSSSGGGGLQELVLDDCTAISDAGLLALVNGQDGCRSLHRLSVAHCCKLTDASLVPLAERGVLEYLNINSVYKAGPATLQALARSCGEVLRELDVSFCRGVTEGSVGALVDRCSRLERLSVYSCTQLTQRFLHGHSRDELVVLGVPTSCL